jgi:hypothetical protein
MTATAAFQVSAFPEITTREQLTAMTKSQLGEILFRRGSSRHQSLPKETLVGMVCFSLKIYGKGRV